MTRYRCNRCQFQSENDGDVFDHTKPTEDGGAGHPRCVLCRRSLELTEQRTCGEDLGKVRRDLRDIADLYALLPAALERLGSNTPRRDSVRHGDGSERLPGGDPLVMLAGGSEGALWAAPNPVKYPTANDNRPDQDPPAVAFALWTWADAWRDKRHEDNAVPVTVTELVQWLVGERCQWAASWFDPPDAAAWVAFANDMSRIRAALARGTGMTEQPDTTDARCLYCESVRLRKVWGETEADDRWVCPRCKRSGTKAHFWVAVVATIRAQKGEAV